MTQQRISSDIAALAIGSSIGRSAAAWRRLFCGAGY
jgi:hypothetical protein